MAVASLWAYGQHVDQEFSWLVGRNTFNYAASDFPSVDFGQEAARHDWGTRFGAFTDIRISSNFLLHGLIPTGNDNTYAIPGLAINICPFPHTPVDGSVASTTLDTNVVMSGFTAVTIFLLYPLAFLLWHSYRRWRHSRRKKLGLCERCGYDLRGSISTCCSECGAQLGQSPPRAAVSTIAGGRNRVMADLVLVVGMGAQATWIAATLPNWQDAIHRCAVPGRHRFIIDEPGEYVVYYENRTVFEGVPFSSPTSDMGRVPYTLRPEGGTEEDEISLHFARPARYEAYTSASTSWSTVRQFHIDEPGPYVLDMWFRDWADGTKASAEPCIVLAVGQSRFRPFVPLVLGSWAIWALAVPAASCAARGTWSWHKHSPVAQASGE